MEIQISIFIISIMATLILGCLIGYYWRLGIDTLWSRMKALAVSIRNRLVDYWYVLILILTVSYVWRNFDDCINLSFTDKFNGKNLVFLFLLVLIVFPMFDSFEGFGISIKKRKQAKKEDLYTAEYLEDINTVQQQKEENNG